MPPRIPSCPAEKILEDNGSISVFLSDPLTDAPGVFLAMDGCEDTTQPFLYKQR